MQKEDCRSSVQSIMGATDSFLSKINESHLCLPLAAAMLRRHCIWFSSFFLSDHPMG